MATNRTEMHMAARVGGSFAIGRSVGAALLGAALVAAAPAMEQAPTRGGTAIIAVGADPATLNPDVSVGVPDIVTGCILYDALVRFEKGFKIVPSLAKSWEISPDALTYRFHLNEAKWADGKPVTSEDVKFT